MSRQRMTISWDDLKSENVEKKLQQQQAFVQAREHYENVKVPTAAPRKPRFTWLYNTVVYMALFGALGGLLGWGFGILLNRPNPQKEARTLIAAYEDVDRQVQEHLILKDFGDKQQRGLARDGRDNEFFQLYVDHRGREGQPPTLTDQQYEQKRNDLSTQENFKTFIANLMFYGIGGLMIAACLGMAESVVERNYHAALIQGSVGALLGLIGGIIVSQFDERIYQAIVGPSASPDQLHLYLARAAQWGVLGLFLSLGPGLLLRNGKKLFIGLIGGLIGGIVGGVLFEPTKMLAERYVDNGEILSRLVGLLAIGIVAGVGTGLIENAVKSGWFKVTQGLIAGKQFVLYRNPTYIGSSPQCHIYLFKDPQVGRRHAAVHILANGGFEIEDLPLGGKTYINGRPIQRAKLKGGDKIQIGSTAFSFQEKAKD